MSEVPDNLRYTKNHEWVRLEDDGDVTVGITDHAQELLGDLVFVEYPEVGTNVASEEACAVVESVKAASDVYAPLAGEVVIVNERLADNPEMVNQAPYGEGWIFRLRPEENTAIETLMEAEEYTAMLESEED
jgi:glycine cleavage system H protein